MIGKIKTQRRFAVKTYNAGMIRIIVDKVTGVNYLNTLGAGYSGLTPLLDENGKVVITPVKTEPYSE